MNDEKKCRYKHVYESCDRNLYDEEHCIFHSTDIGGKKDDFDKAFWKEFERQKKEEKEFDFKGFVFPGNISFNEMVFEKDANFYKATFKGEAGFYKATFKGDARFFNASFSTYARFWEGTFEGKAVFIEARFSGYARFDEAMFKGEAQFIIARFEGEVGFYHTKFSESCISGLFESLRNKGLARLKGRFKIKDFCFTISPQIAQEYPVIESIIKDAWYLNDYKANYPIIYWLWNVTAKCGQSLTRWALWSLFFALIFAFIFYGYYLHTPESFQAIYISKEAPFFTFFYYSVVTFTTLGFGDIVPKCGWLQMWVMLEVILGYVMLGGLISILANKLARRS